MIFQLNPAIPLLTPRGTGEAILVLDYSKEDHLMWVVILDSTGEIWTFPNDKVRGIKNETIGRTLESKTKVEDKKEISPPPEGADWLAK